MFFKGAESMLDLCISDLYGEEETTVFWLKLLVGQTDISVLKIRGQNIVQFYMAMLSAKT